MSSSSYCIWLRWNKSLECWFSLMIVKYFVLCWLDWNCGYWHHLERVRVISPGESESELAETRILPLASLLGLLTLHIVILRFPMPLQCQPENTLLWSEQSQSVSKFWSLFHIGQPLGIHLRGWKRLQAAPAHASAAAAAGSSQSCSQRQRSPPPPPAVGRSCRSHQTGSSRRLLKAQICTSLELLTRACLLTLDKLVLANMLKRPIQSFCFWVVGWKPLARKFP